MSARAHFPRLDGLAEQERTPDAISLDSPIRISSLHHDGSACSHDLPPQFRYPHDFPVAELHLLHPATQAADQSPLEVGAVGRVRSLDGSRPVPHVEPHALIGAPREVQRLPETRLKIEKAFFVGQPGGSLFRQTQFRGGRRSE